MRIESIMFSFTVLVRILPFFMPPVPFYLYTVLVTGEFSVNAFSSYRSAIIAIFLVLAENVLFILNIYYCIIY